MSNLLLTIWLAVLLHPEKRESIKLWLKCTRQLNLHYILMKTLTFSILTFHLERIQNTPKQSTMKKALLFLLIIIAATAHGQSLNDLLFSGKLKSDSGSVVRSSDDLKS